MGRNVIAIAAYKEEYDVSLMMRATKSTQGALFCPHESFERDLVHFVALCLDLAIIIDNSSLALSHLEQLQHSLVHELIAELIEHRTGRIRNKRIV